jgi:signal transduction histidine kinase
MANMLQEWMPELINGYLQAKEHGLIEGKLGDRAINYLDQAPKKLSKIAQTANTFIDMMLMKVNLEKVKSQQLVKLDIAENIREAIELYPLTAEELKLIELDLSDNFIFYGDRTLFRHLIFNLLKNALHYVKEAGKGNISIWSEQGRQFNILHIKDTGRGMDMKVLHHIFESFYSQTRHGTGVGLALCKLIMEELGGKISCSSIEGEYSHFELHFPKI